MTYDLPDNTVTGYMLRASWNNIRACAIHLLPKRLDNLGRIP